jgi:hypothetical protein
VSQDDEDRSPTTTIDEGGGRPQPAAAPAPSAPPEAASEGEAPGGADEARLEALIARLGELEGGLREELAVQVDRAEQAERALAATEVRAVRAEVAARATAPPAVPVPQVPEPGATPPAAAPVTSDADREALVTTLREVRAYLERRRGVEAQIVTIARDALGALRAGRGGTPTA